MSKQYTTCIQSCLGVQQVLSSVNAKREGGNRMDNVKSLLCRLNFPLSCQNLRPSLFLSFERKTDCNQSIIRKVDTVSVKRILRTADCRLGIKGRPRVKCRLQTTVK